MKTHDIELPPLPVPRTKTDGGPWCMHNMPCPVFRDKHAVLNMNTGVFHPSWHAQEAGWKLVKADTRIGKWILRRFLRNENEHTQQD